jgi:hypothetical protein
MKLLLLAAAVSVLALAVSPLAEAKAPPVGKYECTIGDIFFGTIAILPGGRYTHGKPHGTFTTGLRLTKYKDGITGYAIAFHGGDLNRFNGRWHVANAGGGKKTVEIALRNPKDNFESIYCDKV